jgi:hypothetical protein
MKTIASKPVNAVLSRFALSKKALNAILMRSKCARHQVCEKTLRQIGRRELRSRVSTLHEEI